MRKATQRVFALCLGVVLAGVIGLAAVLVLGPPGTFDLLPGRTEGPDVTWDSNQVSIPVSIDSGLAAREPSLWRNLICKSGIPPDELLASATDEWRGSFPMYGAAEVLG